MSTVQVISKNDVQNPQVWHFSAYKAVSVMRYWGGILAWKKDELQNLDRRTCKLMKMNRQLNRKSDVLRLFVCWKKGGKLY